MSARCPVCHERVLLGERFCASCGATIGLLGSEPGQPGVITVTGEGAEGIRPLPPSPPRPVDPPVQRPGRRRPLTIGAVLLVAGVLGGLAALALNLGDDVDAPALPTFAVESTEAAIGVPDGAIATPAADARPGATPMEAGDIATPAAASPVVSASPFDRPAIASPIVEIMPAPDVAATPTTMSGGHQTGSSGVTPLTGAGRDAGEATDVQPRLLRALQRATLLYLRSGAAGPPHDVFDSLSDPGSVIDAAETLALVVGEVTRRLVVESMDPPIPSALPEPPVPSFAPSGSAAPAPTPG